MKKATFIVSLLLTISFAFLAVAPAFAQMGSAEPGPNLGLEYGAATGLGKADVRFTTARIINAALGLLGIIAVVIILYAGFKWMTAGGNEENVKSAQKILFAAVIGLIIILSAYAITRFVMTQLFKATTSHEYSEVFSDNP